MKTSSILLALAAAVLASAVLIGLSPSILPAQPKEPKAAATPKWEYKQVENPSAIDLTRFGEEGWEIVTVLGGQPSVKESKSYGPPGTQVPLAQQAPLLSTTVNTVEYGKLIYVLKRAK